MLDIENFRLLSLADIGATDVSVWCEQAVVQIPCEYKDIDLREFEWWCTPELKVKLGLSTLVNVHNRFFALADSYTRHRVDDLGDVPVGLASPTGSVADGIDGELARKFSNPAEGGCLRSSLALGTVEGVEDIEWRMA